MKPKIIVIIIAAGAIVAGATLIKIGAGTAQPQLMANDSRIVDSGRQIYEDNCASCHGANLEGQPNWRMRNAEGRLPAPPHDETGHTWHHTDEVLFGLTKFGLAEYSGLADYESDMPAYADLLTDDEIIAALSFIKAQWPENLIQRHDEMNTHNR